MPGWRQVSTDTEIAITAMLAFHFCDALPENSEEMGKFGLTPSNT